MSHPRAPIVCLAQHSWESAWARPQQLMSRFAEDRTVLFVRPISIQHVIAKKYERRRSIFRRFSENLYLFSPFVLPWGRRIAPIRWLNEFIIKTLIKRKIRELDISGHVLWLYAPVSEYLVGKLGEELVVYDCTDAWDRFSNVPGYLQRRERKLSREADILFAGTGMLCDEKKALNPNTHLFTCGVDFEHFRPKSSNGSDVPDQLASLPRPIVGYFGLIDRERMDTYLVDAMAKAHPEWSIVLVGPVQDSNCLELGKRRNVHFTGLVSYEDLPRYASHFDVAVIPYLVNDGTRYINPTKLLEYMAAGKPVVSSYIPELAGEYGNRIVLARNTSEFIGGIEGILDGTIQLPTSDNMEFSSGHSWESVSNGMERLVETCL